MIYSPALHAGRTHAVPDRRQQPDVSRVPRDPRPDGPRRPVHQRGLRLHHDAPQADRGPRPELHRRLVRPARRRPSARSWPRTTRPTARRCRATWPSRSRGSTRRARRWACRSSRPRASRRTTSSARWRRRRPRRGSRWRSSPATRTSSSWWATASASTTRATKARGSTSEGVVEKFGVTPSKVVDVLSLMGDSVDNVKGVPGIGEKGARDLIAHLRLARRAARQGRRGPAEEVPRGAAGQRRPGAPQPRDGDDPHRRGRGVRCRDQFRYAGPSRERCYTLFSELGFRIARPRVRAHRGIGGEGLRARGLASRSSRRSWRSCAGRRPVRRQGAVRRRRAACAPRWWALPCRTGREPGALRAARPRGLWRRHHAQQGGGARGARCRCWPTRRSRRSATTSRPT